MSYDRLKSREITFTMLGKFLLKQEFDGLQISMNIKDITIPLQFITPREHSEHAQIFPRQIITSGFFPCHDQKYNAIRVRAKPVHLPNYSDTFIESSLSGSGT